MKNLLAVLSLLFFVSYGLAQQKSKAPVRAVKKTPARPATPASTSAGLKTAKDSLSYAIGLIDANFFKSQGITDVNVQLMARAFEDVIKGRTTVLNPQQADMTVREKLQAFNRSKIQGTIDECDRYLGENAKRPEVKQTASGLQYEVLQLGEGPKPVDTSVVKVHYTGTLLNGTKFDSSRDRGEPASFPLNRVIRGWTEGLQLMPVGSRFKFYIPYQLGYGEQGAGAQIPGGSALIFDVELLEIVK